MIPYGRQTISQQDIDEVVRVLQSDFLTQGPMIPRFESALAEYCHAKFAISVNSGTSALHLACLALEVGPGDIAWTSPISFVASSNCALYCGAQVDFVDIEPSSGNMCVAKLEEKLISAEMKGQLPKVVIPVHLAGQPCDMKRIYELGQTYGFSIIEDACHALGSHYHGHKTGCCHYSDITVFSFHPVKLVTTGEGGAVLTNTEALRDKIALLRSHGITKNPDQMTETSHGGWYYQMKELGFNYRITDIQAVLGRSQLTQLDEFIKQRNHLAKQYDSAFSHMDCQPLKQFSDRNNTYHLYIVRVKADKHRQIFEQLRESEIGVNLHYIPIYKQPLYQDLGFSKDYLKNAEDYYRQAITLPLYPKLTEHEQQRVVATLESLL